ncbi:MAG: glycoside hydrolase family 10 protein [Nitrospinota bacterium]
MVLVVACASARPPVVGLWVQAEGENRTLDDRARLERLLDQASRAGVTDLFVQVYRGGRSWFPSSLADDAPSRRAGVFPLAFLLREGHRRGLRVHAWLNAFRVANNRDAPILRRLGPQAVLRDNRGRSLLDAKGEEGGFRLGTPGIWLDPAHPGVRRYLLSLIAELLRRHPDLDGLHLDFIRYPYALPISPSSSFGLRRDFGYTEVAIRRFFLETGRAAPLRPGEPGGHAWDTWRRAQVTSFISEVRRLTRELAPRVELTAAVIPWADRAYLAAFQDWRGWLEGGLIDAALVMNYTPDADLARHVSRQSAAVRGKGRVYVGLGAYLLAERPEVLWRQWREAKEAGGDGVVLFSYDQMVGRKELWRFPVAAAPR